MSELKRVRAILVRLTQYVRVEKLAREALTALEAHMERGGVQRVWIEMETNIDYTARDFGDPPNDRDYVEHVFASVEAAEAHYHWMKKGRRKEIIKDLIPFDVIPLPAPPAP